MQANVASSSSTDTKVSANQWYSYYSYFFIVSTPYSGHNKVIVIIVLHFVQSFMWYRSVFNQYSYYCDFFFLGGSITSLSSPLSRVNAIFQYYNNYGLVYVIDINTHVLLFCLYYFVVPFTLFWNTGHGFNQYSYYCHLFFLGPA